jgi:hypothetical protein
MLRGYRERKRRVLRWHGRLQRRRRQAQQRQAQQEVAQRLQANCYICMCARAPSGSRSRAPAARFLALPSSAAARAPFRPLTGPRGAPRTRPPPPPPPATAAARREAAGRCTCQPAIKWAWSRQWRLWRRASCTASPSPSAKRISSHERRRAGCARARARRPPSQRWRRRLWAPALAGPRRPGLVVRRQGLEPYPAGNEPTPDGTNVLLLSLTRATRRRNARQGIAAATCHQARHV